MKLNSNRIPILRFNREFNSWFERIKSGNTIVVVTRNGKDVVEMLPHVNNNSNTVDFNNIIDIYFI